MTDYLTGLALRNQRYGRGIRPRLPVRFEQGRGTGIPARAGLAEQQHTLFEQTTEEIERGQSRVPSGTRQTRQAATESGPAFPQGSPGLKIRAVRRGKQKPGSEPVAEEVQLKESVPEKSALESERSVQVDSSIKPLQRTRREKPVPFHSLRETTVPDSKHQSTVDQVQEPGRGLRDRKENTLPEKIPVVRAGSPLAQPAGHGRIVTPDSIRHHVKETAGNGKMTALEPRVQVTIGRIEVRSVPRREGPEHRSMPPPLELSDYLQHRTRRGAS